ncbi:MAG: DNA methyltransferase [Isosphaerales bacterium]
MRLIETDAFPFEFLSRLAERESWRKEIHRPIYHVHKWWAKRLGSVFRGILLGTMLPEEHDLPKAFYQNHHFKSVTVFDPFMGSGTTIGEAHKLGMTALGRDINPVAVESVCTALGPLDQHDLKQAFHRLSDGVGQRIRALYRSKDAKGSTCDVLYFFWVMQVHCLKCQNSVDLFPSWIIARNAYPQRKPEVQILCPSCGDIFPGLHGHEMANCRTCGMQIKPEHGPAKGANATCHHCHHKFTILDAVAADGVRPIFRLYGKLVLTRDGAKEYLPTTPEDQAGYHACSATLREKLQRGQILLPTLALENGHNTRQAMSYAFTAWRDFFNDRQLLALGCLHRAITEIVDASTRKALLTLFSGVLEFNNMFASYKGEGTGAVRHMFSHHILKPERTPIEANVWGTPKSSGAFSNLFRSRLLRAIEYRLAPTEVNGTATAKGRVCAGPFSGEIEMQWPTNGGFAERATYLSCGDSAHTGLPDQCLDLIVTDPPFFDNVHYSELADFFHAWRQLTCSGTDGTTTTRSLAEVQDADADSFAAKLRAVFRECRRALKDDGLLVFTYHHSRDEGWTALAEAILGAGFAVVNSQPVKAEMSVAAPKSQAKEPIQLDIIIVCRKESMAPTHRPTVIQAIASARAKLGRLRAAGFSLSRNDRKIVIFGQLLTTLRSPAEAAHFAIHVDTEFAVGEPAIPALRPPAQLHLFD